MLNRREFIGQAMSVAALAVVPKVSLTEASKITLPWEGITVLFPRDVFCDYDVSDPQDSWCNIQDLAGQWWEFRDVTNVIVNDGGVIVSAYEIAVVES